VSSVVNKAVIPSKARNPAKPAAETSPTPRRLHNRPMPNPPPQQPIRLWCPTCARSVDDPLVCGDCSAVICRVCGTPLESPDELAFG